MDHIYRYKLLLGHVLSQQQGFPYLLAKKMLRLSRLRLQFHPKSGSFRRLRLRNTRKTPKQERKLVKMQVYSIFKVNLHKIHLLCFLQVKKIFKLDPDPNSEKLLDPDPQKNECGSTALLSYLVV